jgi:exosome complex component RRP46
MTLTAVLLAISSDGTSKTLLRNPTLLEFQKADSVHVLAFTSHGELLVAESEGSFTIDDWVELFEVGKRLCCDEAEMRDDNTMQGGELDDRNGGMMRFVMSAVRDKVEKDLHWKE